MTKAADKRTLGSGFSGEALDNDRLILGHDALAGPWSRKR